jgi:hypothetical protein
LSRSYDDVKSTYLEVTRFAVNALRRVELTEPILSFSGAPGPPDPVPDEQWAELHVAVVAFGTQQVDDLLNDFSGKVSDFFLNVGT